MSLHSKLKRNTYVDSVTLMTISTSANKLRGVRQAQVAMGTSMNKAVLQELGLLDETLQGAGNSDLMMVCDVEEGIDVASVFSAIEELLTRKPSEEDNRQDEVFHTLAAAAQNMPDSNLALISCHWRTIPK